MYKCRKAQLAFLLLVHIALVSCSLAPKQRPFPTQPAEQSAAYIQSDFEELDFLDDLTLKGLSDALRQSRRYYEQAHNWRFSIAGELYDSEAMREALRAFAAIIDSKLPPARQRELILRNFRAYRAAGVDGKGTVVFTGYHEPTLNGSLQKSERYRHPLYAPPPELSAGSAANARNPSRRAIDIDGVLVGRGLEIAWVDDPIALFFLHIQGSGKLILANGETLRVTFAGTNGRQFRSLAPGMRARGLIPNLSNAAVKKYLRENLDEAPEILSHNERYTFFKMSKEGALGALGVPLTADRSIAVDYTLFPKGSLAFIQTALPVFSENGEYKGTKKISRFVFCQDTGAAIKGAGRVDLFWGDGEAAAALADAMKSNGSLYILLKKK